jgi:hypothetical protein
MSGEGALASPLVDSHQFANYTGSWHQVKSGAGNSLSKAAALRARVGRGGTAAEHGVNNVVQLPQPVGLAEYRVNPSL